MRYWRYWTLAALGGVFLILLLLAPPEHAAQMASSHPQERAGKRFATSGFFLFALMLSSLGIYGFLGGRREFWVARALTGPWSYWRYAHTKEAIVSCSTFGGVFVLSLPVWFVSFRLCF